MKPHQHSCQICGYVDECKGVGRGSVCEVNKAVISNKQGPFCEMCRHFIMFKRISEHRGLTHVWAASRILDKATEKGISI